MISIQPVDCEQLLLVHMHDPVDKALGIKGHESRAARYASAAGLADQLASIAERLPMPSAGRLGERAVERQARSRAGGWTKPRCPP